MIKCRCIPESISASVYALSNRNKWIFSFVMWAVGFMIAPYLFEIALPFTEFLVWLMIVGLIGIGCDPLKEGEKNTMHYVSATICGAASQTLILFNSPSILLLWGLYVPYTLVCEYSGKNMFMAEIIMIIGIMILGIVKSGLILIFI